MTRRLVIVHLAPPPFTPPGVESKAWRTALAEDLIDGLNGLTEADAALGYRAADSALADAVSWPSTIRLATTTGAVTEILTAAHAAGYDQAAVLAPDIPDLPGLLVGKLLRPLTTRSCAIAPNLTGPGAAGLATHLPAPAWLSGVDLDTATAASLRRAGADPPTVATAPGWRRLRTPDDLLTLDEDRAPSTSAALARA